MTATETTLTETTFQRARRPEQVEARREAILAAARALLETRRLADISLRELAAEVGLAKSNVLRYFESREAIFLELLADEMDEWIDDLVERVPRAAQRPGRAKYGREKKVAAAVVDSLVARPVLSELIASMSGVLEHNISIEQARRSKTRLQAQFERVYAVFQDALPDVSADDVESFAHGFAALHTGMWASRNPSETIVAVDAECGQAPRSEQYPGRLRLESAALLIGLVVQH